ncbi:MAG: glycosyltransferase [Solirubrobacteraceae bacterium]|nr:glycosyltransferase [Solirubrobacteraceae bacterium]
MRAQSTSCLVRHVDIDGPMADVVVPPGVGEVFVVVHHEAAVIAHVRVAAQGFLSGAALAAAVEAETAEFVARRRRRWELERRLGRARAAPAAPVRSVTVAVLHAFAPDDLERCLTAIDELEHRPVEVLVLDLHDDRGAPAVCGRHGAQLIPVPARDAGAAWNVARSRAAGELVGCLYSDALADPHWLSDLDPLFDDCRTAVVTGYVGPSSDGDEPRPLPDPIAIPRPCSDHWRIDGDSGQPLRSSLRIGCGSNMILRRELPGWPFAFSEGLEPTPIGLVEPIAFCELQHAGYRIQRDPRRILWRGPTAHVRRRDLCRRPVRRLRALLHAVRRRPPVGIAPTLGAPPRMPSAEVTAEMPAITFSVASYNRREELRAVLDGVSAQTYPRERLEVVVVLDGSTDGSAEMVRAHDCPFPIQLIEQPNSGLARARNEAVRAARHPVVVFFDDDIVPAPDLVAEHARAHAGLAQDGWVIGLTPPVLGDGWIDRWIRGWWLERYGLLRERDHRWGLLDVTDGNTSSTIRLWDTVGGHDEDFAGRRQDHELGARLMELGAPVVFAERAIGLHHLTANALTIIGQAHGEAPCDLDLAARHAEAGSQLWLGRDSRLTILAALRPGAPRWHPAWAALVQALSVLPVSKPAERVLGVAGWLSYVDGVRQATRGTGSRGFCSTGTLTPLTIPLEEDAPAPHFGPDTLLRFTRGLEDVARMQAAMPGDQFSWESLIDRAQRTLPE